MKKLDLLLLGRRESHDAIQIGIIKVRLLLTKWTKRRQVYMAPTDLCCSLVASAKASAKPVHCILLHHHQSSFGNDDDDDGDRKEERKGEKKEQRRS